MYVSRTSHQWSHDGFLVTECWSWSFEGKQIGKLPMKHQFYFSIHYARSSKGPIHQKWKFFFNILHVNSKIYLYGQLKIMRKFQQNLK